ncbi:phytoene desaturase [Noviherbaspirillum sp. CPCC 100848]|uniref:Phytoene dehydrogenase n=1 Tax=Noviherbaspirillum album TaxID=3080276 RepID=A0ABU6J8W8_9BURK|nr:phytoene desaturase [Noviherbaspirillum sp. CPCC 100848]MEC4719727.1 phytoene desaturase [Noviherbaspirillum sp. CPCC 100848]
MRSSKGNIIKAIVIGSGFGGLALAIRLQSAGIPTLVLEGRDKPGGRAYVYEDQGFTFDAGPTVITDPTALEELFALSGRNLGDYAKLLPVSPFYRLCWEDGYRFDYVNDQQELDRQIGLKSPQDVDGYRKFLDYSKAVLEEGYVKLGHVPFPDFRSMIRVAPQLIKLESYRSVYGIVSRFISDPHLRQAFSFHSLLVGGNPFETSSIYALIHALERQWGVFFPQGGTGALVRGMIRLFEELGGELRLNATVDEICVEQGRVSAVRLQSGERIPCLFTASNADVVHTYDKLLRNHSPATRKADSLKKKRFSMSLFVIYFGLRGVRQDLQHHTVLFGPRYRELLKDIFHGAELPEDFSLYLHAPTVTDPSLAPPGHSAYYVLAPVPHLGHADIDWAVEGPRYRDRILAYLEQHTIPDLRRDLVTSRIFTPSDFRNELNAHVGSAFSLEPVLWQSAYFRTHNKDQQIPGLYFVGAGTHPGAGVPGVVGSAKATARIILDDFPARRAA